MARGTIQKSESDIFSDWRMQRFNNYMRHCTASYCRNCYQNKGAWTRTLNSKWKRHANVYFSIIASFIQRPINGRTFLPHHRFIVSLIMGSSTHIVLSLDQSVCTRLYLLPFTCTALPLALPCWSCEPFRTEGRSAGSKGTDTNQSANGLKGHQRDSRSGGSLATLSRSVSRPKLEVGFFFSDSTFCKICPFKRLLRRSSAHKWDHA